MKLRIKFQYMLGIIFLSDLIKGIIDNQISILIWISVLLTIKIGQLILIAKFKRFQQSTYFILFCYSIFQLSHYGTQSLWFLLCLIEIYQTENNKIKLYCKILQVTLSIILSSLHYQGNIKYSEFQQIIYFVAFIIYQLFKDVVQIIRIEEAENEILQELKKQIIIKIFDQNYEDITPNSSPQLDANPYILLTQNTQMDENQQFYIKCYQDRDFTSSPDQNSNQQQQILFQDCISFLKFINNQDSLDSSEYNHYIASLIDVQKNIKQKFKVIHKTTSLGNKQILAFWKIDNFTVKQTKQKFSQFKKQFTDLFAHKLKTPLNASLGFLSQAYNSIDVDTKTKSNFIKPAYINSKLQYFQISDLLEFLSPQTDKITVQQSKINMKQFLLSLSELIESQCINKRILFQVFVEQVPLQQIENFYIISDLFKLERVLYNILNQSYRHTPSGGQIILSLSLNKEHTEINFVIDGSGCGFSDEDIENINLWIKSQSDFQFKKKHLVIKKELKMSLEITNNLINILSSSEQNLEVAQSEQGTEFRFKINIKESKTMESQQEIQSVGQMLKQRSLRNMKSSQNNNCMIKSIFSAPDPYLQLNSQTVLDEPQANQPLTNKISFSKWQKKHKHLRRVRSSLMNKGLMDTDKSIMIVDDEPFNHDTLILMMKTMGYKQFLKAFNGQQAIDMIQQNQLDICLILMDLDMPIMGGIEATKILIQMMIDLELAYIPIIGCTAHDDKETLEQCIEVGMLHVVLKPVFVKTLREAFQYIVFSEEVKKRSQYILPSQLQI
ncbi:unnamed protein product [Paramecium pentaurelia]|uniref:Response regulatory domain-containing protein n=1 Tax=Paramecium pentaurelia TaxID=43138 RepID=A0A8S1W8X1_9CILI|nr:unnamed protein product [Paramecium pentaurelia]